MQGKIFPGEILPLTSSFLLTTEFLYLFALNGYNKKQHLKLTECFIYLSLTLFAVCECEGMDFFFLGPDQFYSLETLSKKNISAFVSSRIIQMASAALFL